jgi:hypothetical protein
VSYLEIGPTDAAHDLADGTLLREECKRLELHLLTTRKPAWRPWNIARPGSCRRLGMEATNLFLEALETDMTTWRVFKLTDGRSRLGGLEETRRLEEA